MQGHRGTIGSLPEALNFDHGSASNSAGIDPQICWSSIHNTGENRLPNYMLSPNDANITFVNPIYHEQQDLNRWSHGESSSSGSKNEVCHDEQKSEHGWSSSAGACAGAVPRSEGRRNDSVGVNPLFAECSNSNIVVQNLNLNTGFMGNDGDGNQNMEHTNFHKSSRSENEQVSPARGSEYLVEHNGGRPGCALEGRRTSCKRKALEGSVGQSSSSGNCNDFQRAESSVSTALSPCYNAGSGLSISSSSEQVNPRLVLGSRGMASGSIPDSTVTGAVEGSHRNFRLRINHSNQQESINPTLFQSGIVRHSSTSTSQQSSSLLPVDHSLDLRSAPAVDNLNCQSQNTAIHVPALTRNVHPFRWSGGPTSRAGSSTSSMSVDRDAMPREETRSRNLARNMADNHLFMPVPDFRNSIRNPTNRGLTGLNIGIPGNIASTSRVASSSGVQPSSNPAWVLPPPNPPPHFPRRFSELVRRSLLSTVGADSGGTSSDRSPLLSVPPPSPEEMVLPSGSGSQGHHHSYPRSAPWLERQGDSILGIPHSLRALAAGSEGRSRLVVSEIRNVLDLMRRGESLRFEDVMILDQSMFFGVADIHDRHRDMRLDVDNMSYEELLALEERIGNVSTGLSEEIIKNNLKQKKCSIAQGAQQEGEPCCICQEEYNDGEDLGTLECGHDFHSDCIKQWLMRKNSCPICKTTGLTTK